MMCVVIVVTFYYTMYLTYCVVDINLAQEDYAKKWFVEVPTPQLIVQTDVSFF